MVKTVGFIKTYSPVSAWGFIVSRGVEQDVFVHMKWFVDKPPLEHIDHNKGMRYVVEYDLDLRDQGRPKAKNVRITSMNSRSPRLVERAAVEKVRLKRADSRRSPLPRRRRSRSTSRRRRPRREEGLLYKLLVSRSLAAELRDIGGVHVDRYSPEECGLRILGSGLILQERLRSVIERCCSRGDIRALLPRWVVSLIRKEKVRVSSVGVDGEHEVMELFGESSDVVALCVQLQRLLESPWVLKEHPDAPGEWYYLNESTGETTWELDDVSDSVDELISTAQQAAGAESAAALLREQLPRPWLALPHPEDRTAIYYLNEDTGKTTWEKPEFPARRK